MSAGGATPAGGMFWPDSLPTCQRVSIHNTGKQDQTPALHLHIFSSVVCLLDFWETENWLFQRYAKQDLLKLYQPCPNRMRALQKKTFQISREKWVPANKHKHFLTFSVMQYCTVCMKKPVVLNPCEFCSASSARRRDRDAAPSALLSPASSRFALQRHGIENSKQIFPEKKLRGHSPNSNIHVSVSDLYIFPGSVRLFCCRKIGGPILGICGSLTDTWIWGRAIPFLGMHKSKFLCSVGAF